MWSPQRPKPYFQIKDWWQGHISLCPKSENRYQVNRFFFRFLQWKSPNFCAKGYIRQPKRQITVTALSLEMMLAFHVNWRVLHLFTYPDLSFQQRSAVDYSRKYNVIRGINRINVIFFALFKRINPTPSEPNCLGLRWRSVIQKWQYWEAERQQAVLVCAATYAVWPISMSL